MSLWGGHPAARVVRPIPVVTGDAPLDAPTDAGEARVLTDPVADFVLARPVWKTGVLHQGRRLAIAMGDGAERPWAVGDLAHTLVRDYR